MDAGTPQPQGKLPDYAELEPMIQATAMRMHPEGSAHLGLVNLRVLKLYCTHTDLYIFITVTPICYHLQHR